MFIRLLYIKQLHSLSSSIRNLIGFICFVLNGSFADLTDFELLLKYIYVVHLYMNKDTQF